MNAFLLTAAGLSAFGGVAHSVLGERLIFPKLGEGTLPEVLGSSAFTLSVLRLFWHLVSVAWWGFAALLVLLAPQAGAAEAQPMIRTIAITFLASAIVSFAVSRGKHFSWGVLLVTAIVAWMGAGG